MRLVIDTQIAGFVVKSFFAKHKTKFKWAGVAVTTVVVGGVAYYVCKKTGVMVKASEVAEDVADVVSSTAEDAAEVVADAAE